MSSKPKDKILIIETGTNTSLYSISMKKESIKQKNVVKLDRVGFSKTQ